MKSVWGSGRKRSLLCIPIMKPLPQNPPDPTAMRDWMTLYPAPSGSRMGSRKTSSLSF